MKALWVIEFDYPSRNHHGALIRFVNYAWELMQLGHQIYFGVELQPDYREDSRRWFEELENNGTIAGWTELKYVPSASRARIGARLIFPSLSNWILNAAQLSVADAVKTFAREKDISVFVVSSRRLMFLVNHLPSSRRVLTDFGDSMALYYFRSIKAALAQRAPRQIPGLMKLCMQYALQERYYGRRSFKSTVVSPVDKNALARLTGHPDDCVILLNGVRIPPGSEAVEKVPFQIIFTGNMSFPPNLEAATWFLDKVFPQIQKELPQVRIVIAGADPPQELLRRSTNHIIVTGYVEDLNLEIARSSLFVAPLVSGGGFKNKVVEALANRTYVVASPLAVEFLDPEIRGLIRVESDPIRMASAVSALLQNPDQFAKPLEQLHDFVRDRMSWNGRTLELLQLLDPPG